MRLIEKLSVARKFLDENGAYLFTTHAAAYPGRVLRNHMLAAKFGVRTIHIGPHALIRGISAMRIGEDFAAGEGLWLEAVTQHKGQRFAPLIIIGSGVSVSHWSHIAATNHVEIGDGVLVGSKVLITDHNHGLYSGTGSSLAVSPNLRPLDGDRRTVLEKNVWLGDGVVVTAGSKIGEGAVVGANSVVSGEIAPFTMVAGSPARPIRRYDFETNQWVKWIEAK